MIIPVRCYSCGKVMAHIYEPYRRLLDEDYTEAEALAAVGATRYCCRRMLLAHIDLIDGLMPYSAPVVGTMQRIRPPGGAGAAPGGLFGAAPAAAAAAGAAAATGQQRAAADAAPPGSAVRPLLAPTTAATAGAAAARPASAAVKRTGA
jgi:DNA-directed RNA polymerase I, II, and III subunit RPABC5